ncbi:MAG: hypothetical protein HY867_05760 [Chloroflexi bacterium]|nr:hypothetical protein [Chloroflexota bacterium]
MEPKGMENLIPYVIGFIVITLIFGAIIYKSTRSILKSNVPNNAVVIKPPKVTFAFAYFVYFIGQASPWLLLLFALDKDKFYGFAAPLFMIFLISAVSSYLYYTLFIHDGKLFGPTLWGWRWRRLDLDLVWLNKEKILTRNPVRKLGIVVFYTHGGEKILALGLNDAQVNQILDLASQAQTVK